MSVQIIIAFVLAYLIGAIPSSVWIGKIFFGKDVRTAGSKNAGATNTFRVLGALAGSIVLFLDIAKGMIAVSLAYYFGDVFLISENFIYYKLGLGFASVVGHIFSVYTGFKGGKGVATFFGVMLAVFPLAAVTCTGIFLIVFLLTRYVSLGSILASLCFPIAVFIFTYEHDSIIFFFSSAVPLVILFTHRKNIQRLLNGTENKILFSKNNS